MCKLTNDRRRSRRGFGRIEKVASGRYRAGYTGPDGRLCRAPVTFDAKDDATAWLSSRRAEIEMQVWVSRIAARGNFRSRRPDLSCLGRALGGEPQDPGPPAATDRA